MVFIKTKSLILFLLKIFVKILVLYFNILSNYIYFFPITFINQHLSLRENN